MDIEERIEALEREVFGEKDAPMTPEEDGMSKELQILAQEIRMLHGYRWLPGAKDRDGYRVVSARGDTLDVCDKKWRVSAMFWGSMSSPDLTDPLTVEALVVLMREREPSIYTRQYRDGTVHVMTEYGKVWHADDYALAVARAAVEVLR